MAEKDSTVLCNPSKRFRAARSLDEEAKVLAAAVPKTTEYKNRWAVKLFEEWKTERDNVHSSQEYSSLRLMEVENVENLNTSLQLMKAESINFWLINKVCSGSARPKRTEISWKDVISDHCCSEAIFG